jgi:hypothetical protein
LPDGFAEHFNPLTRQKITPERAKGTGAKTPVREVFRFLKSKIEQENSIMSEQTEAKMFENLETLISEVTAMGALYKPPGAGAKVATLTANMTETEPLRPISTQKDAAETLVRHARAEKHKSLIPICTDMINYAKSGDGVKKSDLDTMRAFKKKLAGKPAIANEDDPATPDIDESQPKISTAQTSYPSRTQHFANFCEVFKGLVLNPEEDRFKDDALDQIVAELHAADTAVISAATEAGQARAALDVPLYTKPGNLVDGAESARNYLKSSHKNSQAYQTIKHFRFYKPKRLQ